MYFFEKDGNKVLLDGKQAQIRYAMQIEDFGDSLLVHLHAFKIHCQVSSRDNIAEAVKSSLISFFKYWYVTQPEKELLAHMHALGFIHEASPYGLTLSNNPSNEENIYLVQEPEASYKKSDMSNGNASTMHELLILLPEK